MKYNTFLFPLSIFVPSSGAEDGHDDASGSLFVMERVPQHEKDSRRQQSRQFESLVYNNLTKVLKSSLQPLRP